MARRSGRRSSDGRRSRRGAADVRRPRRVLVVTNGEVTEKQYCDLLNEAEDRKERGKRSFHITCKCKPVDPAKLAEWALRIVENDKRASAKKNGGTSDPYDLVFVVVDVDEMKADNLRKAQSTCKANSMRFVISNPCVEVWLIDHVQVCPRKITEREGAKNLARSLGLTTGKDHKYLVMEKLRGHTEEAVRNAAEHNRNDAWVRRESLEDTDFAPWTDFADLVGELPFRIEPLR